MTVDTEGFVSVRLYGCGQLAWPDLVEAVSPCEGAWADYNGFHIGQIPEVAPPYSHLWAWSSQWLLRVRVDGEHAITGVLRIGESIPGRFASVEPWPVRCTRRRSRGWPAGEKRVGPVPAAVADRAFELWQVEGEQPVTFVRPE